MPRMQSSSSHCCLCSIGVFMFLGGIMMIATGASLILNYGIVNDDLLLPELRNDEGKKIVGIILICVGLVFSIVSVSVSVYYLIIIPNKTPTNVKPDDIKSIASGSSQSRASLNPNTSLQRPGSNQSSRSNGQGARRKISPVETPNRPADKPVGNQFSQTMPMPSQRSKHKHKKKKKQRQLINKTQLEDIKELDTISRKTMEMDYNVETPRSQSELENYDNNSVNTSEASGKIPVYYVSDHSHSNIHHEATYSTYSSSESIQHNDNEAGVVPPNKQTKQHTFGSHDNLSYDGHELVSTDSESTITKNIFNDDKNMSQTSAL